MPALRPVADVKTMPTSPIYQRGPGYLIGGVIPPEATPVTELRQVITKVLQAALNGTLGTWLPCDGRLLSRENYSELYKTIRGTYGEEPAGFRIPNHPYNHFVKVKPDDNRDNLPIGTVIVSSGNQPFFIGWDHGNKESKP